MSMPTLPDLIDDAWSMHRRDPAMLVALGLQIVEVAGEGTAAAGVGWLQVAWGRRYRGERDDARLALQRAQQLAEDHGDAALAADARDLQAMVLQMAGRHDEALALLALNDAMPSGARRPDARVRTHLRRADVFSAQGRLDDALRERYAALAEARDSGHHGSDLSLVAQALQLVGGTLGMLENPEQAEALCAEAAELADRADAFYTWASAALNRMNALVTLERADEALPLAERLLAIEPRLHPNGREQRLIVYADACQQAGQWERAQALLDDSVALRSEMGRSLRSWTVVQVRLWQAQGRHADARDLGERSLATHDLGTDPAQMPSEDLRLMLALAAANEALGELAGALHWQRQAYALNQSLLGRGARARRLALEIEHQLDRERRDRAQAQERHRRAEAERARLDQLNRALEEASLAKTRFLAAASHDLRQPVQALAMYMAALQREALTPAQAGMVERMAQSLGALGGMFDALLDISRLDAGIVPVDPQPLALRPLLWRLHDELKPTAEARGLAWRLHLPRGDALLLTRSDAVLLERCLRNLLDNALKYTPAGGVLLALRRFGPPEAPQWRVQVIDTGLGMAPEVQARVFEEFYQADNPERDRTRGLGLGLAIVQRLLRLLGHPLQLRSRPGRGTAMSLDLPALPEAVVRTTSEAATDGPDRALCVMVVDDDADVRDSLVALLERWGHCVLAGPDDAALLQSWQATGRPAVHAVLADLRLRGTLTGVTAVQRLRATLGSRLPALVITGDIAPDRLTLLRDSGLPWLPKPVMPMRLRSWLQGQGSRQPGPH